MTSNQNPLVAFVLNAFSRMALSNPAAFMQMPKKGGRDKEGAGLPYGYSGAKMARMAAYGLVGVKHKGMRASIRNLAQRRIDARVA